MAKKKKRKSSGKRKGGKSGKRRGGRRGGARRAFVMPNKTALKVAAFIVGVEVVHEAVLPDMIPDFIDEIALGIWLAGYWDKQPLLMQAAYGVEFAHLAREYGVTDGIAEKVEDVTGGILPGKSAAPSNEHAELGPADISGLADDVSAAEELV